MDYFYDEYMVLYYLKKVLFCIIYLYSTTCGHYKLLYGKEHCKILQNVYFCILQKK